MLGRFCVMISRFLGQVLLGTWIIDKPAIVRLFLFVIDLLAYSVMTTLGCSEYFFYIFAASLEAMVFLVFLESVVPRVDER